jgi:septum formation protein
VFYLASASPRRRELLAQLGVEFQTIRVDIDEIWDGKETARRYVSRLAQEKALAAKKLAQHSWPILAADTEVVLDNQILGKPENTESARSMLMSLSGRTHEVLSAVVLLQETAQLVVSLNRVSFRDISTQECENYCASGEPLDKAGGYGIQGKAAIFINRLEGSYSSVMGLPLRETASLLNAI